MKTGGKKPGIAEEAMIERIPRWSLKSEFLKRTTLPVIQFVVDKLRRFEFWRIAASLMTSVSSARKGWVSTNETKFKDCSRRLCSGSDEAKKFAVRLMI